MVTQHLQKQFLTSLAMILLIVLLPLFVASLDLSLDDHLVSVDRAQAAFANPIRGNDAWQTNVRATDRIAGFDAMSPAEALTRSLGHLTKIWPCQ